MSISLNPRESSLSDLDAPSNRQLEDWMSELEDHVRVFPGGIESFLSVFVPSSASKISKPVSQAAFSKYKPKDLVGKDGKRRYANLLSGLRATVSSFPDDKKPKFCRHQQEEMPFPFPEFTSNHVNTFPDISVSLPGSTSSQPDWQHIALFIYVEANEADDPFGKSTPEHRAMVVKLAIGARGLMAVHGHCAAFGLVIYGHWARIARNSSGDCSTLLSVNSIVGCDPTVRKLTQAEESWLVDSLEAAHQTASSNLATYRRVEVGTPSRNGVVPKAYFVVALINLNAHLMSPATNVWRAVEDPRMPNNDGHLGDLPEANANIKVVILKDAWRQLARRSEQDFFARIEQAIPEGERVGLPARAVECDLGDAEVQQRIVETSGQDLRDAIDAVREQASSSSTGEPAALPVPLPAPLPLQQTCTWRIIHGLDSFRCERSHIRTVTSTVGRPLTEFKDTLQLCWAFRDAISAHKNLWENAKILHRNISVGNIRITGIMDENGPQDSVGFLYDFDYSSMVESPSAGDKGEGVAGERPSDGLKERTEMDYFTAIDLLESPGIKHEVWHDLESFLWVLLWIVLHHTDHTHPGGSRAPSLVFPDMGWTRATLKRPYLFERADSVVVRNNGPLSQLITEFKRLGRRSVGYGDIPGEPMTHDEVLGIFDAALGRAGWPPTYMDGPLRGRSG